MDITPKFHNYSLYNKGDTYFNIFRKVFVSCVLKRRRIRGVPKVPSTSKILNSRPIVSCQKLIFCLIVERYIGCPISNSTKKKLNISVTARSNGLIFLPRIEACSHSKSIRTRLMRTFVKYHCWPQQENFTCSRIRKENNILTIGFHQSRPYGFGV